MKERGHKIISAGALKRQERLERSWRLLCASGFVMMICIASQLWGSIGILIGNLNTTLWARAFAYSSTFIIELCQLWSLPESRHAFRMKRGEYEPLINFASSARVWEAVWNKIAICRLSKRNHINQRCPIVTNKLDLSTLLVLWFELDRVSFYRSRMSQSV